MKTFKTVALLGLIISGALFLPRTQANGLEQATSSTPPAQPPQAMVQISTFNYFAAGNYDGFVSIADLHRYGDFGLGTFDRVDGEMVEIDGKIYQVRADGKPHLAAENALTPFANVTFWQPATTVPVAPGLTIAQLETQIDQIAPDQNIFVAIRVEGNFQTLKLRSEEPAVKPYPALTDFLKGQIVFDLKNTSGTLVGIRSPAFSKGLNVVGYHFHFISTDQQAGGHVLELTTGSATLAFNDDPLWELVLPENSVVPQATSPATALATINVSASVPSATP